MPRDGATTVSDLTAPRLVVSCATCGRRGSYNVQRLLLERGDMRLTDFLAELTDTCPRVGAFKFGERCGARYEG